MGYSRVGMRSFIASSLSAKDNIIDNSLLKNFNTNLNDFFTRILGDLITYESWDELKLDYDPYLSQKISIDNGNPVSIEDFPDFALKQLLN